MGSLPDMGAAHHARAGPWQVLLLYLLLQASLWAAKSVWVQAGCTMLTTVLPAG